MKTKKIAMKIRRRTLGEKVEGHKATIVRMAQEHVALRQTIQTQKDRIDEILKTYVSPASWQAKLREFNSLQDEKKALVAKLADKEIQIEFVHKSLFRCKDFPELLSLRLNRLVHSIGEIHKNTENSEVELFAGGILAALNESQAWADSVRACVKDILLHANKKA